MKSLMICIIMSILLTVPFSVLGESANFDINAGTATHPQAIAVHNVVATTLDEASFLNSEIHDLANQIMQNFRNNSGSNGPVAVATFVDINNLYRTSPFGRYLAEQLMGELQRAGFNVLELRKTESILIKEEFGEYGMSRDINEIARTSPAGYVLVGTYVNRGNYIIVNARLISSGTGVIASSGMKIMRKDPLLTKLLWPSSTPHVTQPIKMPVKELGASNDIHFIPGS